MGILSVANQSPNMNHLYYGDNLDNLRKYVRDETVDLCYIDPPFNSKRNYNQIYNNIGKEDVAQAQAFVDTWEWDQLAENGFGEIIGNTRGLFPQKTINLMLGLQTVLGQSSLFAYLISMTLRIGEIHRVLKPTGSFYLHCDPTSSHYLKLVLDSVFCSGGGYFQNEIIWKRTSARSDSHKWNHIHDVIFFYTKSRTYTWNTQFTNYDETYIKKFYRHIEEGTGRMYASDNLTADGIRNGLSGLPWMGIDITSKGLHWKYTVDKLNELDKEGRIIHPKKAGGVPRYKRYLDEMPGVAVQSIINDIQPLSAQSAEKLGYPTQKPEALLERIIKASSNEGDVVLDAYCGCGTTVAVAQKLNRQWIGIDITYQSISLILKRLEDSYGKGVIEGVKLTGLPKDMQGAEALAEQKDDRVRKEFEKWAVLTYSNNRAAINQKKGADQGIDGWGFFPINHKDFGRIIFQVKSGKVSSKDIRDLLGTITREKAELGIFITLQKPSKEMVKEAKASGLYHYELFGRDTDKIKIVTIQEMLEQGKRLDVPLVAGVLKSAPRHDDAQQLDLLVV